MVDYLLFVTVLLELSVECSQPGVYVEFVM
jgi:hypothetical protein